MTNEMRSRPTEPDILELEIATLGAQGDGVAHIRSEGHDGRPLFVPYTVPGDRVRARRVGADRAMPVEWLARGPGRAAPPCPHFGPGKCGGCALQHLADDAYARWKVDTLARTLANAGLSGFTMRPLARTPQGGRRRADLLVRVNGGKALVGFHVRKSHAAVDIGPCPILVPELEALLPALRTFFAKHWPAPASLDVLATAVESGIELVLTRAAEPDLALREAIAAFATEADLARIGRRTGPHAPVDVLIQRKPLRTRFGDVVIDLPPASFLQASAAGERAIRDAVVEGIGTARRIADLYAGCGSIGLALAGRERRIYAADRNAEAIRALDGAARHAGLAPFMRAEARDLNRRPLTGDELAAFDAVIFDPPREGAAEQAQALAGSAVPAAIAVSCNPATFARDAKLLAAGGYRLTAVTPVDQFLWSPHLELAGAFRR
jgi:23S rRNA (uracil1939-C5)-methyltransferase